MKRRGVLDKFKKILVVMIISVTMFFSMPVKSNAVSAAEGLIGDFINLILRIPDGVMNVIDGVMAGSDEFTSEKMDLKGDDDNGHGRIYNFIVTPYEIFSSGSYEDKGNSYYTKIGWLDVNFFSDKAVTSDTEVSSNILRPVVGNIYKLLRNLCMILMLLVILYIGIKIMISSIAEQQAKYKKFLTDWVVGFALLFAMHYIMSGIMAINSMIVGLLSNDEGDSYYVGVREIADPLFDGGADSTWYDITTGYNTTHFSSEGSIYNIDDAIAEWISGTRGDRYMDFKLNRICVYDSKQDTDVFTNYIQDSGADVGKIDLGSLPTRRLGGGSIQKEKWGDNGTVYLSASIRQRKGTDTIPADHTRDNKAIIKLNAMSYMRTISHFALQSEEHVVFYEGGTIKDATEATAMGYSAMYLCMVIETIMFLFTYIKRVLQMAFLTMIAPIVAIMYPVDKLGDGKAQAFNTWFKDYLFNMLIQPMHLLLYTVFIVAGSQLVSRNIIYGLVIYAFMIPAEKFFKKILGFEKAPSGGGGPLGGAIGHSLAMDGLGKLAGIGPAATAGKGGSGGDARRKPKLGKNKPDSSIATAPSSGGTSEPGGAPSSGGNGSGSGSGGESGSNGPRGNGQRGNRSTGGGLSSNGPNSNGNQPSSNGGKKRGVIGRALNVGAKRAIRGATGGAYGSWNDLKHKPGAVLKEAAKNHIGKAVKFTGKSALKLGGAAVAGSIGAMVGAATAMATGDINNLWKGATVGAGAGSKIGANIYDKTIDGFGEEMKAERAKQDDTFNAKLRTDKAYEKLNDELGDLNDDDYKKYSGIIDRYAQYVDFDSLKDVKAMYEAEQDGQNADEAVQTYLDAKTWSNVEQHEEAYYKKTINDMAKVGKTGQEELSSAQVTKILEAHKTGDTSGLSTDEIKFYKKASSRYERVQKAQDKL